MASSTDFKIIYDRYLKECATKDISIVQFCQMNGIVYSQFEKWYKRRNKVRAEQDVSPIEVVNVPLDRISQPESVREDEKTVSSFTIAFSNGLEIHQKNIGYRTFRSLVEKLEVLC